MSGDALPINDPAGPSSTVHAAGSDWSVAEYVCTAGPGERPFEERHSTFSVAVVTDGTFRYRASQGTALLYPGAMLLGNHGTCYECGHDHSTGDRCFAFHYSADAFADVAASVAGSGRWTFRAAAIPTPAKALPLIAAARTLAEAGDVGGLEDASMAMLESVLGAASGAAASDQRLSALDERRVSEAIGLVEERSDEALSLATLSRAVSMSKFHFLRTFRRVTGLSPHQYVLRQRLSRAARRLVTTAEPVSTIAFDAGFGDLSTFNARFRRVFGESPSRFRQRHGARMPIKR